MPKATASIHDFSLGELSPKLRGRYDNEVFYRSLEYCRNFMPESEGPTRFRTGTTYVAGTPSNNETILIPYTYTTGGTSSYYALEISNTSFGAFKGSDGSEISVSLTGSAPWATADLFQLKWAQYGNTLYVAHPGHEPQTIERGASETDWTIAAYNPTSDPWTGSNDYPAAIWLYEGRIYGGGTNTEKQTIWGSQAGDLDDFTTGPDADDGLTIVFGGGKASPLKWGMAAENAFFIGTTGGPYSAGAAEGAGITPGNIRIRPMNEEGVADLMPVIHQNRIFYADRTKKKLYAIEVDNETGSYRVRDYSLLAEHLLDAKIKQIAFADGRPDLLYCVLEDGKLLTMTDVGAPGGWAQHTTGASGSFESVCAVPRDGASDRVFVVVKRTIDGSTVRYIEYFNDDVRAPDLVDYFTGADNETTDRSTWLDAMYITQRDYIHVDCAYTYDGSDQSYTMTPGATTGDGVTFTASGSTFVSGDVGREIWEKDGTGRAVIATYTSATAVECDITSDFASTDAIAAGSWYLTQDTITGLSHLEGESLTIITDGGTHSAKTVSSGSITLDKQSGVVHVGLGYEGTLITHDIEGGSANGPSQTKPKHLEKANVRFFETLGAKVGTDIYNLEEISFTGSGSKTDRPPELFTGVHPVIPADTTSNGKRIIVRQETAAPCVVQLIMAYLDTTDD